jgi:hypothetical protein
MLLIEKAPEGDRAIWATAFLAGFAAGSSWRSTTSTWTWRPG